QATEVGYALLLSPLIGFAFAALLLLALRIFVKHRALYKAPKGNTPPPWWIRGMLILTCTGVSFAHGSNDGQKGMGLIMLILIGILPAHYALNPQAHQAQYQRAAHLAKSMDPIFQRLAEGTTVQDTRAELSDFLQTGQAAARTFAAAAALNRAIASNLARDTAADHRSLRLDI